MRTLYILALTLRTLQRSSTHARMSRGLLYMYQQLSRHTLSTCGQKNMYQQLSRHTLNPCDERVLTTCHRFFADVAGTDFHYVLTLRVQI